MGQIKETTSIAVVRFTLQVGTEGSGFNPNPSPKEEL